MSKRCWVLSRSAASQEGVQVLAGLLLLCTGVHAQTAPQSATPSQLLTALRAQQQALAASFQQATSQGVTPAGVLTWQRQNAAAIANENSLAVQLSNLAAVRLRALAPLPSFPSNVPQAVRNFVVAGTALANARTQIHNQLVASLPANPTSDQVSQLAAQEEQVFEQQHGSDLQAQEDRILGLGIDGPPRLPTSCPLQLPANIDPNLAAFLNLKKQIMEGFLQMVNQYSSADSTTRMAAIQQWKQQNEGNLATLQSMAKALAEQNPQ